MAQKKKVGQREREGEGEISLTINVLVRIFFFLSSCRSNNARVSGKMTPRSANCPSASLVPADNIITSVSK